MRNAWVLSYPLSAQRRLWSDWADAQADLSLRWANSHFVGFVVSRLILCYWSILMFNIVSDKPSIRTTLKKYCLKVVLLFFFFFHFPSLLCRFRNENYVSFFWIYSNERVLFAKLLGCPLQHYQWLSRRGKIQRFYYSSLFPKQRVIWNRLVYHCVSYESQRDIAKANVNDCCTG